MQPPTLHYYVIRVERGAKHLCVVAREATTVIYSYLLMI